ncbi:Lysosomal thioesterase PPT2 [Oryzias melastigma]|uniref:palmitoyl-CoA hydrolase n=1 Tax=Oryzias melastigma TaxID=30732 RepID=A0A834FST7_ORYME|nr:Lysosomal thioesterase PPT2 [Oryzias melastigma]
MRSSRVIPGSPALVLLPLLLLAAGCTDAYKPVIIVHGIFDGPKELAGLSGFIEESHPGTEVILIDLLNYKLSIAPMWKQVNEFGKVIKSIMQRSPEGVHLLCFSQGGLVCRGVLSLIPNHNVHTFISLSSPLAGQFGDTEYVNRLFPDCAKTKVHLFCYNKWGQKLSICDYWKDPHYTSAYLRNNLFLPLLNGEKENSYMTEWKENFLRIKKLVLIGGPDDGVITPWQSSHFAFYDSEENVVEMRNQEFYVKDTFGLQTLDARGDLSVCVQSGVKHVEWHSNFTVFTSCMVEWLV